MRIEGANVFPETTSWMKNISMMNFRVAAEKNLFFLCLLDSYSSVLISRCFHSAQRRLNFHETRGKLVSLLSNENSALYSLSLGHYRSCRTGKLMQELKTAKNGEKFFFTHLASNSFRAKSGILCFRPEILTDGWENCFSFSHPVNFG